MSRHVKSRTSTEQAATSGLVRADRVLAMFRAPRAAQLRAETCGGAARGADHAARTSR